MNGTASVSSLPTRTSVTRPTHSRWLMRLLVLTVALSLVAIALQYARIELLTRTMGQAAMLPEAQANDGWLSVVEILQLVVLLATGALFLLWIYRSRTRLATLGVRNLAFSPVWAVAGFIVPALNLILPVRIVEELWKASDPTIPGDGAWQGTRPSHVIEPWWGAFLLAQFLDKFTGRVAASGHTASDLLLSSWIELIAQVVAVVAALLALRLVRGIESRLQKKESRLAEPMPAALQGATEKELAAMAPVNS